MSLQQINQINFGEKILIMKTIFHNYKEVSKLKNQNSVKINDDNISKIQLFALTDTVINLMEQAEQKIIKNNFLFDNKPDDKIKLHNAIDKFVYYLLV